MGTGTHLPRHGARPSSSWWPRGSTYPRWRLDFSDRRRRDVANSNRPPPMCHVTYGAAMVRRVAQPRLPADGQPARPRRRHDPGK